MSTAPTDQPPLLNIANVLTVLRFLLVPFFLAALLTDGGQDIGWRYVALGLFVLAALTDRFDGQLARSRGLVTAFGTFLDPVADKALIGAALVGLSVLGLMPWWATVVIMGRELAVTGLRLWVLRQGVIPASRGGKVKTAVQAVAIGLFLLPLPDVPPVSWLRWTVLAVALVLTVGTGLDYALRGMRLRHAAAPSATEPSA